MFELVNIAESSNTRLPAIFREREHAEAAIGFLANQDSIRCLPCFHLYRIGGKWAITHGDKEIRKFEFEGIPTREDLLKILKTDNVAVAELDKGASIYVGVSRS